MMFNKKTVKLILSLVGVVSVLTGCDNSDQFFESLNNNPVLLLETSGKKGSELVSDSVKLSTANAFHTKDITLAYLDENSNIKNLIIQSTTQDVYLIQEDTILISDAIVLANEKADTVSLQLFSFEEGFKQLNFIAIDQFGKEHITTFELFVFPNLIPVVNYDYTIDHNNQFIVFNFQKSYDPDSLYGGMVQHYELNFNGETIIRDKPSITVIYSDTQVIYDYSVRVRDNDGAYSYIKSDRIRL